MEEDVGNNQVDLFYDSVCEFYKTAFMYYIKWFT